MSITIKKLCKKIGKVDILKDIDLNLENGKVYGLVGINGSGKTMLMRAICGLIKATTGEIYIDEKRLGKDIDFPESIGVLIENPSFLPSLTARENLALLSEKSKNPDDDITDALKKVGLNPNEIRKYKKFSLGMKQRLGIAGAIVGNPQIVILDEPLNALDDEGISLVYTIVEEIKKRGGIVILACHYADEIRKFSDSLIYIENGQISKIETEVSNENKE